MRDICTLSDCTGCMACVNVCVHNAIIVKTDEEGFDRPCIDNDLCIECGLCVKTCPMNSPPLFMEPQKVFSGWSSNESVRLHSSSGGAFTEIARPILENGGVVFGCALNERLQAEHIYVETLDDLTKKLIGSKYVQSNIGDSYIQAKSFLRQGRKVLFSGTPCHIAGLRNYLKKDYDNLLTVDLICHGVPSPKIFEDYKNYIEKKEKMKLTDVKFRCKKSSWIFFNMAVTGHVEKSKKEKIYIGRYYDDPYIRGFLRDYFLRPSCHQCHFTSTLRCSDFTIADWWGYKKTNSEDTGYEQKGVSLIFCNTQKSVMLSQSMKMVWRERTLQEAVKTNMSLIKPFIESKKRKEFWIDYSLMSFDEVVKKYMSSEKISLSTFIMMKCNDTPLRRMIIRILNKVNGLMIRMGICDVIKL